MKRYKVLFYSLFAINLLALIFFIGFVLQKGGVAYLQDKLNSDDIKPEHIQRESLFETLHIKSDNIVFVGDSLVQRNEWSEMFNNDKVLNRGIDGDKTSDVLSRIKTVSTSKPQQIFLSMGINDIDNSVPVETILKNYIEIIGEIRNDSPNSKIYVHSVLPVASNVSLDNNEVNKLNDELLSFSEENDVHFIDIASLMVDNKGNLNEELTVDGTHLNGQGYGIWKKEIIDLIE